MNAHELDILSNVFVLQKCRMNYWTDRDFLWYYIPFLVLHMVSHKILFLMLVIKRAQLFISNNFVFWSAISPTSSTCLKTYFYNAKNVFRAFASLISPLDVLFLSIQNGVARH